MLRVLQCLPIDKKQTLQQALPRLTFSIKITRFAVKPKPLVFSLRMICYYTTLTFYLLDPQSGMLLFCLADSYLPCFLSRLTTPELFIVVKITY